MKKIIIFLALLLMPVFVSASIDQNLYYGLIKNSGVRELQQYLIGKGFLSGQATGNFFSLTFNAVKKYQASKNINATGYVGPLTRQAINADLAGGSNTSSTTTSKSNPVPFSGSLDLSQNSSYSNQSVIAPQLKFKLADFSLKNNTTEPVNLNTIEIDLAIGSDLYSTNFYVSNLYVTYGNSKTTTLSSVAHNNYWTISYQLPVGQTIDLSVYGDVNSLIPQDSAINSSLLVAGATAVSATNVSSNSNAVLSGQNITFGRGSLTVGQDSSAPASKIVAVNQKIVAGKFQFTANNDSYTISELKFVMPGAASVQTISSAVLSDSATQSLLSPKPIAAAYDGSDYIFDFSVSIPVPINSSRSLTISYNLSSYTDSRTSNINIAPVLAYVKAANSGGTLIDGSATNYNNNIIASYNGITLPSGGIPANSMYVFKSIPTLTASSSGVSAANGSDINLYTFSIAADPNADVSVKQLMFTITITDPNKSFPHLNTFTFFKGNSDYTGAVYIGYNLNNNYFGLTSNNGIGIGTNTVAVTFDREETIPAGKTQTYTLKAYVNNFISSSDLGHDSISTYIPSDSSMSSNAKYLRMAFTNIYGLAQTPTTLSVTNYNLLWSDKSAYAFSSHNDLNGFSTDDWYNGFGVPNLPLASQSVTAN